MANIKGFIKKQNKMTVIWLIAFLLFIIISVLYLWYTWVEANEEASKKALQVARTAAAMVAVDEILILELNEGDIDKKEYQKIKSSLQKMVKIDKDIRFTYLYTQKNDKIVFIADSEPVDSSDYSPPGEEYSEDADVVQKIFLKGQEVVTEAQTDNFGNWNSAIVPIKDIKTGKVIAALGIDYPASIWERNIWIKTLEAGIEVFFVLLVFAFLRVLIKNEILSRANEVIRASEEKFSKAFNNKAVLMAIVDIEGDCYVDVNNNFLNALGYSRDEVIGKNHSEFNIFADEARRLELNKSVINKGYIKDVELMIRKRDGSPIIVLFSAEAINVGGKQCWLKTMLDIT